MTSISASGFGSLFSNSAAAQVFGAQANWAVDPVLGRDANVGTPAEPLATMAELNARLHTIRFTVAVTITFVGNVIDAPFMFNGVLAPGLGMDLNGTVTTERTGTISVVAGLGTGGNTLPWQLTTTGITWSSADVGKRVTVSTGHLSWVQEFVDANNVITGAFVNSAGTVATPTPTTFTVDALSQILTPTLNGMANSLAQTITFSGFDIQNTVSPILINQGSNLLLTGCKINKSSTQFIANGPITARGCGFIGASTHTFSGSAITTLAATTWVLGTFATGPTQMTLQSHSATNCPHTFNSPLFSQMVIGRIRNTANPITVQNGGVLVNSTGSTLHGATGNTGVGITVRQGSQFQWVGAGTKPTLTGVSDVQVGTTGYTYAQLGTGIVDLVTASPPVITGSPAAMFQV